MPQVKSKVKSQKSKVTSKKSLIVNRKSSIVKSTKPKRQTINNKRSTNLSIPVYSLTGRSAGTMSLPKEIFGVEVNENLLAQALSIYLNNQKTHWASTKTRGEITASKRKIYRQKGTGRARHGAISAPIFVGGGIALGPKYRKTILDLPKKMKKKALLSSLSQKMKDQEIVGVSGLDKATGKTKEMAKLVSSIKYQVSRENKNEKVKSPSNSRAGKKINALFVVGDKLAKAQKAVKNLAGVDLITVDQINVLEISKHQSLILTKEAVEKLQVKFITKEAK